MSQLSDIIGNTPLLKISDKIYAKLETYNPTGSVKDRMVHYVVNKAFQQKKINRDSIFCEATSGNTGIALSAVAASYSVPCRIFMPSNMSTERRQMMRSYGAEIIDAPPNDFEAAISMRDQFINENKNAWSPLQFSNPDNTECHRIVTAPEIHRQVIGLEKKWCAFIHGSGTGGTIEGIRQFIKNSSLDTKVCMVMPAEMPHGIQGINDGKDFLASVSCMDDIITIKTDDAIKRAKKLARDTGIFVGISSGANILASEKWLEHNNPGGIIVTILCDRGERYMSVYNS
jgi:cysteine synthase A